MQDEALLLRCIENSISDHLGDGVRLSLFKFLEDSLHLPHDQIPAQPELFRQGLEKMFGATSAGFVEKFIVQEVNKTFHLQETDMVVVVKKVIGES